MAQKYIYWDNQHRAGYKIQKAKDIVKMEPIKGGVHQTWSALFFETLLRTKQIEVCNIGEYEEKVLRQTNSKNIKNLLGTI